MSDRDDPDIRAYIAGSHHHFWCETCQDGHDDRGVEPGECAAEKEREEAAKVARLEALEDALRKLRPYFGKLTRDDGLRGSSHWDAAREAFAVLEDA